eukprot:6465747-Alexandrium_andersonii.AAC.1
METDVSQCLHPARRGSCVSPRPNGDTLSKDSAGARFGAKAGLNACTPGLKSPRRTVVAKWRPYGISREPTCARSWFAR